MAVEAMDSAEAVADAEAAVEEEEMEKNGSRVHLAVGAVERALAVAVGSRLVPKADHAVVARA